VPLPDPILAAKLVPWFREHGRAFPWRDTRDPYLVLSAELMLQRTRASQVAPVFEEFRDRFGGPAAVVAEGRGAVDDLFARLGLRWRAEHFWDLQQILAERGGVPPDSLEGLLDLPGVGAYAATAVCVFALGQKRVVVDSNVLRILGRYYGIVFDDTARRRTNVLEWASRHAPDGSDDCRNFNWALLDLGATVCVPGVPDCQICPLVSSCIFGQRVGKDLTRRNDAG
jgi:A/G-specific adenine glycosylase